MSQGSDDLPVLWEDLPALLSSELSATRPRGLTVRSVSQGTGSAPQLVMIVEASGGGDGPAEKWRLAYDVPLDDLTLLGPAAFVVTVRANIEEWWDTRPDIPVHLVAERID